MILVKDDGVWKDVGGGSGELFFDVATVWVPIPSPISSNIYWLGRIDGYWYITGNGEIYRSQTGFNWESVLAPPMVIMSLAFSDGVWVAVGAEIYTRTEESAWVLREGAMPSGRTARSVARAGDNWVVVGANKTVTISQTGETWESVSVPTAFTGNINSVAARPSGSLVVAVSDNGGIITSSNQGESWTNRANGFGSNAIYSVASNGANNFVAAGASGKVEVSPNGSTWTPYDTGFGTTAIQSASGSAGAFKNQIVVLGGNGDVSIANAGRTSWAYIKTLMGLSGETSSHIAADGNEILAARYGKLFLSTLSVRV